ncbi:MAG: hypothetical protein WA126_15380 [Thermodesulfovibrionales bacterium]
MLGNKYVAAAVGVILILVLAYNIKFFTAKSRQNEVTAGKGAETLQRPEPVMPKAPVIISEQEDKSTWKRDPFSLQVLLQKKTASKIPQKPDISEGIHLTGIIKRNGKSLALINGKVYREDDRIGDVVIKAITKKGIVISSGDQSKEISFEDYKLLKEKSK